MDFLIVPDVEITRSNPLKHLNVLFVEDVNPLKCQDLIKSIREALKQGVFLYWNQPKDD